MIAEDYVSFETAKLLKEKGFIGDGDVGCRCGFYSEKDYEIGHGIITKTGREVGLVYDDIDNSELESYEYLRPTLQMAMKWLREVHKLYCDIKIGDGDFAIDIISLKDGEFGCEVAEPESCVYPTYEEAAEAAIKYCLKNLVKNEDEKEESDIPVPKTVEEAISTLEKILSDEDREYLLKNGAISMHHSLGTWIRNEWGLWTGSELKNELKKKGFEHPDDMSNYIIEEFIKYWNNKL